MKEIEVTGSSKKEVIQKFIEEYNVSEDKLDYKIIEKGSKGFLMFKGKEAIIKFFLKEPQDYLEEFLVGFFKQINVKYESLDFKVVNNQIFIEISNTDNPGFVIGKEGRFLEGLQHLLNRVVNSNEDTHQVFLDIDGYRKRHDETLIKKVRSIIEKVKKRQKSITLEPMSARDRRTVHQYISKDSKLRTLTIGNGKMKRIVIFPVTSSGAKKKFTPRKNKKREIDNNKTNEIS